MKKYKKQFQKETYKKSTPEKRDVKGQVGVIKYENEHIDSLIRRFQRQLKTSNILELYNDNLFHEKPSVKRRKKLRLAKYNQRKRDKDKY